MGLVDPSILQQRGNPLFDGIQQGQGIRQNFTQAQNQGQDRQRVDAAKKAFQTAAQGKDITTPDGMKAAIQGMAQAGFANEASAVYEAHKDMFPQTKLQAQEWGAIPGTGTLYEKGSGQTKDSGAQPYEKPIQPKEWDPLGQKKLDEETRHNKAMEAKAAFEARKAAAAAGIRPEHTFTMEQKLSNDFKATAGKSIDVATANSKINEALSQNNPLDAYNAIVQFVKIIDPGTAAREGEVNSAVLGASGGTGARLAQAAKRAYNGTLDAETVKNVRESAAALMRGEKKTYAAHRKNFQGKIKSYNDRGYKLDENAILGDYDSLFQDQPAAQTALPTHDQYDSLPSGAEFTDPDGNVRRKP